MAVVCPVIVAFWALVIPPLIVVPFPAPFAVTRTPTLTLFTVPLLTMLPVWLCPSLKTIAVTAAFAPTVGLGMGLGLAICCAWAAVLIPAAMARAEVVVSRRLQRFVRASVTCSMGRTFTAGGMAGAV